MRQMTWANRVCSLIAPALLSAPPTLAQLPSRARARALYLIARSARCDVRWSPLSSPDPVKLTVAQGSAGGFGSHRLLLQIGGTDIAS
jgi:hypothetical protein